MSLTQKLVKKTVFVQPLSCLITTLVCNIRSSLGQTLSADIFPAGIPDGYRHRLDCSHCGGIMDSSATLLPRLLMVGAAESEPVLVLTANLEFTWEKVIRQKSTTAIIALPGTCPAPCMLAVQVLPYRRIHLTISGNTLCDSAIILNRIVISAKCGSCGL